MQKATGFGCVITTPSQHPTTGVSEAFLGRFWGRSGRPPRPNGAAPRHGGPLLTPRSSFVWFRKQQQLITEQVRAPPHPARATKEMLRPLFYATLRAVSLVPHPPRHQRDDATAVQCYPALPSLWCRAPQPARGTKEMLRPLFYAALRAISLVPRGIATAVY